MKEIKWDQANSSLIMLGGGDREALTTYFPGFTKVKLETILAAGDQKSSHVGSLQIKYSYPKIELTPLISLRHLSQE